MNKVLTTVVILLAVSLAGLIATTGVDPHPNQAGAMSGPYSLGAAITKSDTNELANYSSAIYVGVSGDVKVTTIGGSVLVFKAAPVGLLQVRAKLVWSTGTTATDMVALY